jgi:hypoxanthine phosphoribosyltransferase
MDLSRNIEAIADEELKYLQRPPILGRQTPSELAAQFRTVKLALKEKGYPIQATKNFVRDFFKRNEDIFSAYLDKNSVIVAVPSGSGLNMVTELFAQMLQKKTGCERVSPGLTWKLHTYEAKHNLSLEKRLKDPIGYGADVVTIKEEIRNKRVFILDDLIGSGESAVKLKQTLNKGGITVEGFVNLVNIDKSNPSVKDITRVITKIGKHTNDELNPDLFQLTKDCCKLFGEYTRQKLNRVEREIRNEKTAIKAKDMITYGASLEKEVRLTYEIVNEYEQKKVVGLHT